MNIIIITLLGINTVKRLARIQVWSKSAVSYVTIIQGKTLFIPKHYFKQLLFCLGNSKVGIEKEKLSSELRPPRLVTAWLHQAAFSERSGVSERNLISGCVWAQRWARSRMSPKRLKKTLVWNGNAAGAEHWAQVISLFTKQDASASGEWNQYPFILGR